MKKLISLILALMLMLPAFAGAETAALAMTAAPAFLNAEALMQEQQMLQDALDAGRRVEYNVTFGDLPENLLGEDSEDMSAAIIELVDMLALDVALQGDESELVVSIGDNEVFTGGYAVSGDDYYVASNLLGGTVVFTEAEIQTLVNRVIDVYTELGEIDAEEAANIKEQLPTVIETIKSNFEPSPLEAMLMNLEGLPQDLDYTAFANALTPIAERVVVEEVTGQTRNSDPAKSLVTITLTNEDMRALFKAAVEFVKTNPSLMDPLEEEYNAQYNSFLYTNQEIPTFTELLDKAIAELDEETFCSRDAVVRLYLGEDGMPVLADITCYSPVTSSKYDSETAEWKTETTGETVTTLNYVRLTTGEGKTHSVTLNVADVEIPDVLLASMTANVIEKADTLVINFGAGEDSQELMTLDATLKNDLSYLDGVLVMNMGAGQQMTMGMTIDNKTEGDVTTTKGAVSLMASEDEVTVMDLKVLVDSTLERSGVDFTAKETMSIVYNGNKVFGIKMDVATKDPAASIMSGEVVRPTELNDDDFGNWIAGVQGTIEAWPMMLLMALPQSMLQILMGGGM